jgi:5-(carboxyamino)imidazole ribonucleotide mutase
MKKEIAIIMGSDSDWPVMKESAQVLEQFNVSYHCQVLSAHRTPEDMIKFAQKAREAGFKAIIAAAGGAAHLPGMVASCTTLPVIGVPIRSSQLSGVDSLLSIVQMPRGIPVATVAINNSQNAALLAISILATESNELASALQKYRDEMADESRKKSKNLNL